MKEIALGYFYIYISLSQQYGGIISVQSPKLAQIHKENHSFCLSDHFLIVTGIYYQHMHNK